MMRCNGWISHRIGKETHAIEDFVKDNRELKFLHDGDEHGFYCSEGYCVGLWEAWFEPVDSSHEYNISIDYRINGKHAALFAVVLGESKDGRGMTMAYMQEDGSRFTYIYHPIENVSKVKLQLLFRCNGIGSAYFTEPQIEVCQIERGPENKGYVCVGTTCFGEQKFSYVGECIPIIEDIIDRAAKDVFCKPDIMLFTETTLDRYVELPLMKKGISEDCEWVRRICQKAKEHQMHIIFGLHERTDDGIYNTAYVVDENGEIIGKQRKVQITYNELISGIIPGEEIKVIDTKFGKIGIAICWDVWYPEVTRELYKQGANILFHLTAGKPTCLQQARARENGIPLVASFTSDPRYSCIYNQRGEEITHVESVEKGYTVAKINLKEAVYAPGLGVPRNSCQYGACARDIHKAEIRKDLY